MKIRKYKTKDKEEVINVCKKTLFFGKPMELYLDDCNILIESFMLYYTKYEPESFFVCEHKGKIIGYIMGTKNNQKYNWIHLTRIFPYQLIKLFFKEYLKSKRNRRFFNRIIISFLKGELYSPDSKEYPSHLHIEVLEGYRGKGVGSKLMEAYLIYLKREKVRGAILSTYSYSHNTTFFKKFGFKIITIKDISFFDNIIGEKVRRIFMGRKL